MLQDFRDNLSGVAKSVLVVIIIIPFALFGVDALFETRATAKEVANINGDSISELSLQQAILVRKQQISSRVKDIDPSLLDDKIMRPAVLKRLIRQKIEEQTASDMGMAISKKKINSLLVQVPEFQTNGRFNPELYEFVVKQMGYTPTSHYKAIYSDLLAEQFFKGVVATGFSTEKEQELIATVLGQTRDYYYLTIPIETQKNAVQPSDEDISNYYENHMPQFMTEEQVLIEYIELKSSDLLGDISVDASLIEEGYQEKVKAASLATQYRAAHILLDKKADNSHLTKITAIQEKLKNNEDFVLLAEEYSDDFLTSEKGGDLGYVRLGDLPSELDLVLERLAVGEISEIIETKAGIHLLKLSEKKEIEIPNRELLEPAIREEIRLQIAAELMPEKIEELKELTYNATSLQDVSSTMGLDLSVSDFFGRSGGEGVAASKKVINAAFSSSVIENGYASEVIEFSDDHVLVLSVRERSAPKVQPLTDVKIQIKKTIQYEVASENIVTYGSKLKELVKSGESIESVARAEGLAWQVSFNTKIDGGNKDDYIRKITVFSMRLPDVDPAVDYIIMPNGDYVLVALTKVAFGNYETLRLTEKQAMVSSRSSANSSRDYQAYIALLHENADIASE